MSKHRRNFYLDDDLWQGLSITKASTGVPISIQIEKALKKLRG